MGKRNQAKKKKKENEKIFLKMYVVIYLWICVGIYKFFKISQLSSKNSTCPLG